MYSDLRGLQDSEEETRQVSVWVCVWGGGWGGESVWVCGGVACIVSVYLFMYRDWLMRGSSC